MPERGVIGKSRYFPKRGDLLVEKDGRMLACDRIITCNDPRSGKSFKIALLIAYNDDPEKTDIVPVVDSKFPLDILENVITIERETGTDAMQVTRYVKNAKGNYVEAE